MRLFSYTFYDVQWDIKRTVLPVSLTEVGGTAKQKLFTGRSKQITVIS